MAIRHYQMFGNAKCPRCGEINILSEDRLNQIKCKGCKDEFCFQCGRMIPEGKEHFEVSNCHYKEPQPI